MASLPLKRLKVLELAGLAPVPFCGMLLADFGASVTRIDPIDTKGQVTLDKVCRNKKSLCVDLKSEKGRDLLSNLVKKSDVLLDPYRPGVLEKFIDFESLPSSLILCRISGFGHYENTWEVGFVFVYCMQNILFKFSASFYSSHTATKYPATFHYHQNL